MENRVAGQSRWVQQSRMATAHDMLTGHGLSGAGARMIYGSEVIDKVLAPGSQPSQQADA